MCGRFGLFARLGDIEGRYDAEFDFDYQPRYNIAPEGEGVAGIRNTAPDTIDKLHWGFIPSWVNDPDEWPSPINARAETFAEKQSFKDAFENRLCLIPANGFYEWRGNRGSKRPYWIGDHDDDIVSFAGIWDTWEHNGDEITSMAIITTDANSVVADLHDRMPVILEEAAEDTWLEEDDPDTLHDLLDPYPSEETEAYEVSTAVNDPTTDAPTLIEPLEGQQSGLDDY